MRAVHYALPLFLAVAVSAQQGPAPSTAPAATREIPAAVARYIKVPAAEYILLENVRVIDGTGAPARENQMILLHKGKIEYVQAQAADFATPIGTVMLDLKGRTVFPGIVGMHDHMYYIARPNLDAVGQSEPPLVVPQMTFTSPHLYLGAGVTTLRTTGSVEPYADLNLRKLIDAGDLAGPHMDVTGPYLEGAKSPFIQMHQLVDADDARRTVAFWADQGATSFKAYMNITRAELGAAIVEAHKRGLKVTGHLCAVTYPEAVELGIDNLEHGFYVNTQLDPGKTPDVCPPTVGRPTLAKMTPDTVEGKALIALLVSHHVALTSTLPVFESADPRHVQVQARVLDTMSAPTREAYLITRNGEMMRASQDKELAELRAHVYANNVAMERAFVAAGGLLLAGPDPTGDGGVLPGYGDQREIELLVEAGFSPVEAIKIATLNGATYLGRAATIGSIEPGKDADLVVVKGDPNKRISDIENTEIVFKDGVGYDSQKLLDSAKGRYGQY